MQSYPSDIPVVIVGAGPTGLTTGLLLAEYGVKSVILDRNSAPMDIPRAIVLDDEGARTIQSFGADETYVRNTIKGEGAEYFDDNGVAFARVGSGAETYGFAKRHFVNQPEMEAALHERIAATPLCEVRFDSDVAEVNEGASDIVVNLTNKEGAAHQVTAQYVVAADGGRSPIRERLGIEMTGSTYAQDWIVIDTLNDTDLAPHSKFICSVERPHVSIPAPNGGRRYEFMLLPGETHKEVLEEAFVRKLLKPYRDIEAKDIIRSTIYTFHARIADQFRVGRILLAGDAAHLTPPFAGQGMNAGLRDANNLAWKLAAIVNGGAADGILGSYQNERRDPAWAMIQLAVVMGDIIMPIEPEQQAFRNHMMASLAPFPGVQDYLLKMKFKPRPRCDQGLFLDLETQPLESSLVGEMITQPDVDAGAGSEKLDTFLGNGFALIAQDKACADALSNLDVSLLGGLPLSKVVLDNGNEAVADSAVAAKVLDERGKPLRTHRDQILLIRPDRYCAAAFSPSDLETGLQSYASLLGQG
ncbi:3-(3-hydroxy-phenyl)propionate hydroxylase [Shimia gijangensis]|uniref:3-(3-hydroxy-phenyl)propionate hydroxylase n=1 Tax=Shimia gijangensis TaxID=1470563 RepID=A0A1M6STM1_9RHOB|nr:bifunctional 3-(3-hydroxy-phenyl)propionate/3-hydroxycinnamic acid hydroxylase [Shimia gijangensis]SHK48045.1 3-(3-hydroxy-phenyl)propionate hydroxylase [Shimia gijangensis]